MHENLHDCHQNFNSQGKKKKEKKKEKVDLFVKKYLLKKGKWK